ncbi:MAG: cysteine desulfurase [Candidatus Bathyarchaeota archaeon B63]|nr:MAG: cysteine desulfurase [Candidatus Bathyarchaeota archaeon B63]
MKLIYLDNATTTALDPEVLEAMKPYFSEWYGVPTHEYGHSFGLKAREALEKSREVVARSIGAEPDEIIFTSGGTESNNLAIKGAALAGKDRSRIITSMIEHSSVLNVVRSLGTAGFQTSYLRVDGEGFVDLEELKEKIDDQTLLVSIQHANQEIGTIQDIEEIGRICREKGVLFHVDAVQSFTKVPIDVERMNIDLLSISAHKIHGPKGVGALYVREGVKLKPLIEGEHHEFGLRSGTENIPGIVGFAKAIEVADESHVEHMRRLRDRLIDGLLEIGDSRLNGPRGDRRLCNNVNVTFKYVEGESVLLHLDMRGIIVTTGSACFSKTLQPSHVILALGLKHEDAHGSVRFSLSKYNTMDEMNYTIRNVREVIEGLRAISPVGRR